MEKQFRTAIIGCGGIAQVHAAALATLPQVQIVAVCDKIPERAAALAEKTGAQAETDFDQVIAREDVQVVHLCVPHYLHAPMAIAAMRAGKYVLTEKPMAISVEQAEQMNAVSDELGGRLGVIFQNRYNAASQFVKKAIDEHRYGKLVALRGSVAWYRTAPYYTESGWRGAWDTEGGGVLINQSIHTLDLVQWFGGKAVSVKGAVSTDSPLLEGVIEVEDSAHAQISFGNGVSAIFYATNAHRANAPVEIEAVFEQGGLLIRGDALYEVSEQGLTEITPPSENKLGEKGYWGNGHAVQIADYYASLAAGQPPKITGHEAIEAVKLLRGIYASSQSGQRVNL